MNWMLRLIVVLGVSCGVVRAGGPPNFVVVLIDDMGWGDLSCFGNREGKTPAVDRLAAEGGRFSQFYVNAPICSPSRCALVTGQYGQRWRVTSYLEKREANRRRGMADWLDPSAPSLARMLRSGGYATGHFGKWHLGGQRDVDDAPGIGQYGYDESLTNFEGMGPKVLPLTLKPGDVAPGKIWGDAERLGGPFRWVPRAEITGAFVERAIGFMRGARTAGKPFYVNVWPDDVHTPLWPPVSDWRDGKRGKYLAVLENLDRQLGVLFEFLRSDAALRENTLVLLCSDNGAEPGAGSGGPLRGCKGSLYEGGIRSPLVVWGPGLMERERAGFHNDRAVLAAMDVVPSLLRLSGVAVPEGVKFDGVDASEVLLGKAETVRRDGVICWMRPPDRAVIKALSEDPLPDVAVRDGEWKLLSALGGERAELYRVREDPGEAKNLAADNPDVVARLMKAAREWLATLPPGSGDKLGK
jgi:arylsulfatase A-like enzyme